MHFTIYKHDEKDVYKNQNEKNTCKKYGEVLFLLVLGFNNKFSINSDIHIMDRGKLNTVRLLATFVYIKPLLLLFIFLNFC